MIVVIQEVVDCSHTVEYGHIRLMVIDYSTSIYMQA